MHNVLVSGLKPYTIIKHPETGKIYMVGNGYLAPGTDYVNKIDLLPIEDVGHSRAQPIEPRGTMNIYNQKVVAEEMGLTQGRQYQVNANTVDFAKVFGMSLEASASEENPAKHLSVPKLGMITSPSITGRISKIHENINGRRIEPFKDGYIDKMLRTGRAASTLARDPNVLPAEEPKISTEVPLAPKSAPEPTTNDLPSGGRKIDLTGIPPKQGSGSHTPTSTTPKPEKTEPKKFTSLADLGQLIETSISDESQSDAPKSNLPDLTNVTFLEAARQLRSELEGLTEYVLSGGGSDEPSLTTQWKLKDNAPKDSPFQGQTLQLGNVFRVFSGIEKKETAIKMMKDSLEFVGPKTAKDIYKLVEDLRVAYGMN